MSLISIDPSISLARENWEAISHIIEGKTNSDGFINFPYISENNDFLIRNIRTNSNENFQINLYIGSRIYIISLPSILCYNEWHNINPRLSIVSNQYWGIKISPAIYEVRIFIGGLLYRKT